MFDRPEALLIYPPVYDFALYDLYLKPFGLEHLAAMLSAGGWNVRMINALDYNNPETITAAGRVRRKPDGTGKFHRQVVTQPVELRSIKRHFARYGILPEEFERQASAISPDAVFISSGMTYWYRGVIEAIELCRRLFPDIPIITGGVYTTLMPEHAARVCGPDYNAAGSLTEHSGTPTEGLSIAGRGLHAFLESRGLPGIAPPGRGLPGCLMDLSGNTDAAVLRLNEGCPMSCEYCASRKLCGGFFPGRPEAAFERLKFLNEKYDIINFAFYDDALLFSAEEVFMPFLRQIIDYCEVTGRKLNFYTPNALHIRYMTSEIAQLMKSAGFKEVRLGFESSSPEFHSDYDNKYSERGFHRTIDMLTKAGFGREEIIVYILAGLPAQRASEVEDTIRFASGEGLSLSVSEFSPVPGSPLWPQCVETCRLPIADEPLYHNNSFFPMEWEGFTREDMQRLKKLSKMR